MDVNKKIYIWIEDNQLRKAIFTDCKITFYDENDKILIIIKNPSDLKRKQIEQQIIESNGKTIDGSSSFTYLNNNSKKK